MGLGGQTGEFEKWNASTYIFTMKNKCKWSDNPNPTDNEKKTFTLNYKDEWYGYQVKWRKEDSHKGTDTPKSRPVFITFTDLYKKKQEGLEALILEHGAVYISGQNIPPIKITLAEIN